MEGNLGVLVRSSGCSRRCFCPVSNPVPPVQDQARGSRVLGVSSPTAALGGPKVPPGHEAIPSGPDSFIFLDITGKNKSLFSKGPCETLKGSCLGTPLLTPALVLA